MNTEYRLRRLERTLGTLISWLPIELGSDNLMALLAQLNAPEDPNCLEGPGRTEEEVARNARELDAVAPTPAEKFALMFGDLKSGEPWEDWLSRQREKFAAIERELETARKERDELRERVEKVIGHWRDTDWFHEEDPFGEIAVGVLQEDAIKLLKYLKP